MKTNWITFYSYKGGVGRSMALANVAANLATIGRKVVMIDFDLEAPGLDSFEEFANPGSPGVVEYIDEFWQTRTTPPIERFVYKCDLKSDVDGEVWLMPSGRKDSAYADRLHHIDWNSFYDTGIAQPFIANWKKAIERAYKPDYVLIDSRTGLTDIGGVCTLHFPDIVVLLFALNRQNLNGTAGVRQAIMQVQGREPIQIVTVASPLPNQSRDSSNQLSERLNEAERVLGTDLNAVISYFPSVALVERLWTLDTKFPQPRIAEDYRLVMEKILGRLRDGFDFVLRRAQAVVEVSDDSAVDGVINALEAGYGERAEAFRMIARLERMRGNRPGSLRAFERALSIDPTDEPAFEAVVAQYRAQGRTGELRSLVDDVVGKIANQRARKHQDLWIEIAECYMQLSENNKAIAAYETALASADSPRITFILRFNIAEARRRSTKEIQAVEWMGVIDMINDTSANVTVATDLDSVEAMANRFQAIHIAYAVTGDSKKADEYLERAITVAVSLNPTAKIFSVAGYTSVSTQNFIAITNEMRAALARGELWDGMKLPSEDNRTGLRR